jgi:hypothetical protein
MDGEAQSYISVAAQADVFSGESTIKNFTFSNLNLNGIHGVKFTVVLDIDSQTLMYKNKYQEAPEEVSGEEII